MSTFLQNTSGDLDVTNGECTLVTNSAQAGAQKLRNQFKIFLGEWYLDQRIGMPYFAAVLGVNPNIPILEQLFGDVIRNTVGVASLDSINIVFNRDNRSLAVTFAATWNTGEVITAADLDEPFLVQIPQAQGLGAGGT